MTSSAENETPARARRRTFLIDRSFQLKYTLIIVLVGVVVSAILGYFIFQLTMENRELLGIDAAMANEVAKFDSRQLLLLGGFVVVMAVFLFAWGIIITHRVAGPVFIISRYLGQIRDGQVPQTRPLRRADELKGFFEVFAGMVASLKQRNVEEAELLEKVARLVQRSGNEELAQSAQALLDLAKQKRSWGE